MCICTSGLGNLFPFPDLVELLDLLDNLVIVYNHILGADVFRSVSLEKQELVADG